LRQSFCCQSSEAEWLWLGRFGKNVVPGSVLTLMVRVTQSMRDTMVTPMETVFLPPIIDAAPPALASAV
jgi:hypothetical protein